MDKSSKSDSFFEAFVDWLEKSINPEINPREDFYGYACGRFNEENYDRTRGEYPPPMYGDAFEEILENESIQCPLIQKVRDFRSSLPDDPRTILRDEGLIEFCGGFPAFNDNWSSENFDWIKAAGILEAMDFDLILSCSVNYLDERKLILVGAQEPEGEELENAEDILRNAELNEDQIYEIINDVNIIKEQFDRITPENDDDVFFQRIRRTFADLVDHPFDFQKYFESLLGHPLREDDVFHLNYYWPDQLDRILNVYAHVPPRTLANYITFKALHRTSGRDSWRKYLTLRYFTSVLLSVGFDAFWNESEREKRVKVSEIFKISLRRFCEEHELDESEFSDLTILRDEQVLQFINCFLRREQLEEEYVNLDISRDNFFQNIINVGRLGAPLSLRKCNPYRFEEEEIFYDSKSILEFVIRHWKKPLVYYFSGWNTDNWDRVIRGLEIYKQPEDYTSIGNFFRNQINSCISPDDEVEDSDFFDLWISDFIHAVEKLRKSYNDYKLWLDDNEKEAKKQDKILSRLNLNSKTAFFVSFMQHYCYEEDECRRAPILAVLNCEDFAREFECTPNSCMNPKDKCIIKWNKK